MKITIISDTHALHREFPPLEGDVLIHCGDMFNLRDEDPRALAELDEWFGQQRFELILCIGGNHDYLLQDHVDLHGNPFRHAVYLEDASYLHKGIHFYGAPWVPDLGMHAYYQSAKGLRNKWSMIPSETDVLITHTPPSGILDKSSKGYQLGCEYLSQELPRIAPRLHCFGHVHASPGVVKTSRTIFVNASSVNSQIELARKPITIELPHAKSTSNQ